MSKVTKFLLMVSICVILLKNTDGSTPVEYPPAFVKISTCIEDFHSGSSHEETCMCVQEELGLIQPPFRRRKLLKSRQISQSTEINAIELLLCISGSKMPPVSVVCQCVRQVLQ